MQGDAIMEMGDEKNKETVCHVTDCAITILVSGVISICCGSNKSQTMLILTSANEQLSGVQ